MKENLLDVGLRGACLPADRVATHRRIAPSEDSQAFLPRDALDNAFADQPLLRLDRQKHHPHSVCSRLRKGESERGALARSKQTRDLDHILSATFGLWDLVLPAGKRFKPR